MIKKLEPRNASDSAYIHGETMKGEFLPSFGNSFLVTIHQELLKLPDVFGFGFFEKNTLQGFILGTVTTKGMMKKVIFSSFPRLIFPILKACFLKPKTVLFLWETVFYGGKKDIPEMLVLAVLPDKHRRKIGTRLFAKLKRTFKNKGLNEFSVGTLAVNIPANAFYKKQNGILKTNHTLYEKFWNVYHFNLK